MLIESFDVVFYTAIFVLPGFIINGIISAFNPTKKLSVRKGCEKMAWAAKKYWSDT